MKLPNVNLIHLYNYLLNAFLGYVKLAAGVIKNIHNYSHLKIKSYSFLQNISYSENFNLYHNFICCPIKLCSVVI